jgi:hypothetical protein
LESGILPTFHYILKRTVTFLHRSTPAHSTDPLLNHVLQDHTHFHALTSFIQTSLHLPIHHDAPGPLHYPLPTTIMTSLPAFFDSKLHTFTTQDIRSNTTTARQTCTYVQHMWPHQWGRSHPLYNLTHISHRKHTAFLCTRLMRLQLPAYPSAPTTSLFRHRTCHLHTHPLCPPHTHPCPFPGDLLHAIAECPHLLTHMQRIFPSYQLSSLATFFSNPQLPLLASQTWHIYNYILSSPPLSPGAPDDVN